jgi:hypothetical protein
MKLPNPDRAIIDEQKLTGYCLNPNHADGQLLVGLINMVNVTWLIF